MASIINIDDRRLSAPKRVRERRGTAQVLFFTGVRYERGTAAKPLGKTDGTEKPIRRA